MPGIAVLMADGTTKPIEDVELGDLVWAADPETGEEGPREVTRLITGHGDKTLVDIEIDGDTLSQPELCSKAPGEAQETRDSSVLDGQ